MLPTVAMSAEKRPAWARSAPRGRSRRVAAPPSRSGVNARDRLSREKKLFVMYKKGERCWIRWQGAASRRLCRLAWAPPGPPSALVFPPKLPYCVYSAAPIALTRLHKTYCASVTSQ